jgi:hypothetical protein
MLTRGESGLRPTSYDMDVEATDTESVSNRYILTKATVNHGLLQSRSVGSAVLLIREER